MCFFNLGEENFLKVAAFVIFPTSAMVLFEVHQRVKGHFLNEWHVPFSHTKGFLKLSNLLMLMKKGRLPPPTNFTIVTVGELIIVDLVDVL